MEHKDLRMTKELTNKLFNVMLVNDIDEARDAYYGKLIELGLGISFTNEDIDKLDDRDKYDLLNLMNNLTNAVDRYK